MQLSNEFNSFVQDFIFLLEAIMDSSTQLLYREFDYKKFEVCLFYNYKFILAFI